jgi:hypothetical protein
MANEQSDHSKKLIEFAHSNMDFAKIIENYSRGGEYTPLFLRTEDIDADGPRLVWLNAWLASEDHVDEIEASSVHLQGRYFQHGFHPGYGTNQDGSFYEPIYGGSLEPLALGWSADSKRIDPELSQEFERCYNLTRIEENQRTVWESWKEALDDVVVLEKRGHTKLVLAARTDFVRDFQYLRKRWLLIGVYGEWGNRMAGEPQVWAIHHEAKKSKLYLFGIPNDSGYKYVEAQGYFLFPVPLEEGFSSGWGLGLPAGLKVIAEKIEFQTSAGRVKPWEVREGNRFDGRASATAAFDQEVLRRYQSEPGADVSLGNIGQLEVTSKKVHLRRIAMLLGTEYVSVWLGDFVEGVPPSEWAHWQSFNIPFIGFDRQKELFEAKNLFRMVARLIRQTRLINKNWLWVTEDDRIPFNLEHNTEKDYAALTKALPRRPDAHELTDRAKALDGLIIECIRPTPLKAFLKRTGFATKDVEELGSIKLLSTFMMVARIAETVEEWHDSIEAALSYAHKKVASWQKRTLQDLAPEELKIIELTAQEFEIMFMLNDLRLLAAHPIATQLDGGVARAYKDHSRETINPDQYRNGILWLYDTLSDCLGKWAA